MSSPTMSPRDIQEHMRTAIPTIDGTGTVYDFGGGLRWVMPLAFNETSTATGFCELEQVSTHE